ncbi:MAG: hypothetical protein ISS76_03670 [Phycisphaerae bacterium]|nr:hypothetical protein [Phycisphaerae bacterium]
MFFVVDKPRLQRMIAIVREDRTPQKQGYYAPFLRIKAVENELTISSDKVSATFPATVYEPGVLFIKTTNFRRVLRATKINGDFLTVQVTNEELVFADVRYPFESLNMILYPNPENAPTTWPPPPPKAEQLPKVEILKALYRHKTNGQIFAIETDEYGNVVSTAGPLLFDDLNPGGVAYDNYLDIEVKSPLPEYELLSKLEYKELLKKTGFFIQETQRSIFDELKKKKQK